LLRIVFVRKNRTVAAGFKSTTVLEILEKNYKTYLASLDGDAMIDDINTGKGKNSATLEIVKAKIEQVLTETGLGLQRAGKLDQNDFLKLLYAFHQVGIHFA
jgi:18S rRNA (adenine1779-N6/adenine1780-N6)-dimethyltransferase